MSATYTSVPIASGYTDNYNTARTAYYYNIADNNNEIGLGIKN